MKKPRKKHRTHAIRYKLTKARMRKVYQVYKKTLSLTETGRVLGYTKEWVRSMLAKGQRTGAIQFQPAATLRLNAALAKMDKSELIRAVGKAANARELLSKYKLKAKTLNMLLKHHGLNYREIKRSCATTECLVEYLKVCNKLMHPPNTYEMQRRWVNLYSKICYRWGTLEKFKKAHGFLAPAQREGGRRGMILHICSRQAWKEAKKYGEYRGDTLKTEGFIHCSTPSQVGEVANFMFKGTLDLILLVIDEKKVVPRIKYEDPGNKTLYPHIYGPLNLSAITKAVDFPPGANGYFELPSLCQGQAIKSSSKTADKRLTS